MRGASLNPKPSTLSMNEGVLTLRDAGDSVRRSLGWLHCQSGLVPEATCGRDAESRWMSIEGFTVSRVYRAYRVYRIGFIRFTGFIGFIGFIIGFRV